ncbi:MAG: hypothetical protein JSS81_25185 [Acidobacteria bacterium]|nr:hypothetical protein [Acidobacteriota bacterium]
MKNKITILIALAVLFTFGLGCGMIQKYTGGSDNSSSSNPSKPSNGATDPNASAKTGVAECDEFIDLLNNDSKNPDEDFVTKKIREYAIDFARESIKKNIEENKGDKEKIAKGCRDAKDDYIKKKNEKEKDKNSERDKNTQKS